MQFIYFFLKDFDAKALNVNMIVKFIKKNSEHVLIKDIDENIIPHYLISQTNVNNVIEKIVISRNYKLKINKEVLDKIVERLFDNEESVGVKREAILFLAKYRTCNIKDNEMIYSLLIEVFEWGTITDYVDFSIKTSFNEKNFEKNNIREFSKEIKVLLLKDVWNQIRID
ncbi:uncharacterized protein VNE69_10082 [Vairimorpha necatrix]|uniref:Uncharacterized protein n=1 Tax=Vairimorpha necatrix TaxID=6039 RepID=A0AAX4JG10_9MICR